MFGLAKSSFVVKVMLRPEQSLLADGGLRAYSDLEAVYSRIGDRLRTCLDTLEDTSRDNRKILILANRVWEYLHDTEDDAMKQLSLSETEKEDFALATVLADIGKSGPLCEEGDATCQATRKFVQYLYEATRSHYDPKRPDQSVADFLQQHAAKKAGGYIRSLDAGVLIPGLTSQSTLRAFFDTHTQYTLDLLLSDPHLFETYPKAVLAAAAHHWIQGSKNIPLFNGQPIINIKTGKYQIPGFQTPFDRVGVWVMVLDKYEASYTRTQNGYLTPKESHDQAIEWLKGFMKKNEVLANFSELKDMFDQAVEVLNRAQPYLALDVTLGEETPLIE